MKRSILLLFQVFFISWLFLFKIQAQVETNPIILPENKIIVQVNIAKTNLQKSWTYTVSAIQFPKVLIGNAPLSFEIRSQNKSVKRLYLHIDHIGSKIRNEPQVLGATMPIPIPPDGPGNGPLRIIEDQLPQETSNYLFGLGNHKLIFSLRSTNEINSIAQAQEEIDFSILLSAADGNNTYYGVSDTILAYPNPFIHDVIFHFTKESLPLKNTDTSFILSLYNQNGVLKDQIATKLQRDSKIRYTNGTLSKGRYYYVITLDTGRQIDSGILIKQ